MGKEKFRHGQFNNMSGHHDHHGKHMRRHRELVRYRRVLHAMPLMVIGLIVLVVVTLYKWSGQDNFMPVVTGLFAFLLLKEILQALFFKRMSKKIIDPLIQLKAGFDDIGEGDYSARVEEAGRGDMRRLFQAFNIMAEKLEENEKLKKQYEENRKLLVANISHDLKTPITTVQGYLEVLDEGVVSDPQKLKKYVRVMKNNTEYLNRLIDDLFLFSKLDIDQVQFEFAKVEAKSFFMDMMEEFQMTMSDAGFEIDYRDTIAQDRYMNVDGKRIHRAIRNIMDNSVKYAKSSDTLKIDMDIFTSGDFLTLKFRDYGPGIPDDKLVNVFDRFFRVDDERTKNLTSTGLGLAITKELITAHGGRIAAGNHESGGVVFVIQLPLVPGA